MGVANLCAAFPAAWLADRWSRTAVIRTAVIIGAFGFCSLVASVVLGDHIDANKQFLCICASTAIVGCFVGSQSSAVEAIFGDSIPSGSRSRLYVRKQSLRVLGTAAGPLLAVVVFATVGDHWREGELEIVIACGACLFFCPALLVLARVEINQRRVDGVGSPRHRADAVTGTTSRPHRPWLCRRSRRSAT